MKDAWLFGVVGLLGLALIGQAVDEVAALRRLRRNGIGAAATVVRHRRGNGGRSARAVLRFEDEHGRAREFETGIFGRGLPVGGRTRVLHLPGRPDTARVDQDSLIRRATAVRLGAGLLLLVPVPVLLLRG